MLVDLTREELDRLIALSAAEEDSFLFSKLKLYQQTLTEVPSEAGTVSGLADQVTQKYKDGF